MKQGAEVIFAVDGTDKARVEMQNGMNYYVLEKETTQRWS